MTQQVNLYDPNLRRKRELLSAASLVLTVLVLLLIVGVFAVWSRSAAAKLEAEAAVLEPQAKALQGQLLTLGQQVSTRKPDAKLEQGLATVEAKVEGRNAMLAILQKGLGPEAVSFAEYLRGFARQTPSGLWLTGFTVESNGTGMEIRGRTIDPALIPEYIKRLSTEKAFQGRAFSALQLSVPAPAIGSNVAPAPAGGSGVGIANSPRAAVPYHEFVLTPALQAGTTDSSKDNSSEASPPLMQSPLAKIAPEAMKTLAETRNKIGGEYQ